MKSKGHNHLKIKELGEISVFLNHISPNPHQPRKLFDSKELQKLANSIKSHGLLQSIVIRKVGKEKYIIIAGERRYRAHILLGLQTIKARVIECSEEVAYELSLLENIQRKDISLLEEASAYEKLEKDYKYPRKEIGKIVGKSAASITNIMSILGESPRIREAAKNGELTLTYYVYLKQLPEGEKIKALSLIKEGMSHREFVKYVHKVCTAYKVADTLHLIDASQLLEMREGGIRTEKEEWKLPPDFKFFYIFLGDVDPSMFDYLPKVHLLVPAYGLMHDKHTIRTTLKNLINFRDKVDTLMIDSGGLPAIDRRDFRYFQHQKELLKFYEVVKPDICVSLDVPCYPHVFEKWGISKEDMLERTFKNAKEFLEWNPKWDVIKVFVTQGRRLEDHLYSLEQYKKLGVFKGVDNLGIAIGGQARSSGRLQVEIAKEVHSFVDAERKDIQFFHFFGVGSPQRIVNLYKCGFNSFDSSTPDKVSVLGIWVPSDGTQQRGLIDYRSPQVDKVRKAFNWVSHWVRLSRMFSDCGILEG